MTYVEYLPALSNPFGRTDIEFTQGWTAFYWAWWISWSPFVGMFIARISRGRTVREFVVGVLLVPTGFTFLWMTVFVVTWITLNVIGNWNHWDPYPFILLNLAFSTQASYSAPLILLAQTRQAERDGAHALADAQHREELAEDISQRQGLAQRQSEQLMILLPPKEPLSRL